MALTYAGRYDGIALDPSGKPQRLGKVYVTQAATPVGSGAPAQLYDGRLKTTLLPLGQPVTADQLGNYYCYLVPVIGGYDFTCNGGSYNDSVMPDLGDLAERIGAVLTVAGHSPDTLGNVTLIVADIGGAATDTLVVHKAGDTMTGPLSLTTLQDPAGDALSKVTFGATGPTVAGGLTVTGNMTVNAALAVSGPLFANGGITVATGQSVSMNAGNLTIAGGSLVTTGTGVIATATVTDSTGAFNAMRISTAGVGLAGAAVPASGVAVIGPLTLTGSLTANNGLVASIQEVVDTVVLTAGGTQAIPDVTVDTMHAYTFGAGNVTFTFPVAAAGKSFTLALKQDATGGRTAIWPTAATVRFSGGTAPTLTITANKTDYLSFVCTDGTHWDGMPAGLNF